MIAFAFWSVLALTSSGILTRALVVAYTKAKNPGGQLIGIALQVWILVALVVWLRP